MVQKEAEGTLAVGTCRAGLLHGQYFTGHRANRWQFHTANTPLPGGSMKWDTSDEALQREVLSWRSGHCVTSLKLASQVRWAWAIVVNHPVFLKWVRPSWLRWLSTQKKWRIYFLLNYPFFLVEGECEIPLDRCTHCWILPLDVVHSDFCSRCYLAWNKRRKNCFQGRCYCCRNAVSGVLVLYCFVELFGFFTALTWLTGFQSVSNIGKRVVCSSFRDFYTVAAFYNYSNHLSVSSLEVACFSTWGCMNRVLQSFVKNSFGAENRP